MAWFVCRQCGHSVAVRNTFRNQSLACMKCGVQNVVVDELPSSRLAALEVGQSLEQVPVRPAGEESSGTQSSLEVSSSSGVTGVGTTSPMLGDDPTQAVKKLNLRLPVLASIAITIVYVVLAFKCWNLIEDRRLSREARVRIEREFSFSRTTPEESIEETIETLIYLVFYAVIGFAGERFIRAWSGLRWCQYDIWNVEVFGAVDVEPSQSRNS